MSTVLTNPASEAFATAYHWHPLVHHTEYEENLYYLLIRLASAKHRPVAEQVRCVLDEADVHYACEYSVFGYWDALVRVWLNSGSYQRLARTLKRTELSNVAKFEAFETKEMRYLWSGQDRNLLEEDPQLLQMITRREREIRRAVDEPGRISNQIWKRLEGDGLVIDHGPANLTSETGNVKFYIALERSGGDMPPEGEQEKVLNALATCGMSARSSLYTGVSEFARYLVRCVADSYGDVLGYSAGLDIALNGTRLRPMTLLVANTDARESDWVNHPQPLPRRVETTLGLLDLDDGPTKFPNLTARDWDALHELVQSGHELAEDDTLLRDAIKDILRACLNDNHDELSRALAFIPDSEWFFSKYLHQVWGLTLGDKWPVVLRKNFEAGAKLRSVEEIQKPPEKWTLGNFAYFAIDTASFSKVFDSRLRQELSLDWKEQVARYAELRNEPAHGKLRDMPHLDTFRLAALRALLLELMDVAALCARCRRAVESGNLD